MAFSQNFPYNSPSDFSFFFFKSWLARSQFQHRVPVKSIKSKAQFFLHIKIDFCSHKGEGMYWQKSASSAKSDEVEVSSPVKGVPRLKNLAQKCARDKYFKLFPK
jgi:hypothetical protein